MDAFDLSDEAINTRAMNSHNSANQIKFQLGVATFSLGGVNLVTIANLAAKGQRN